MRLETFIQMVQKQYRHEGSKVRPILTGAERYVSGDPTIDHHLHYLETSYGLRVYLSNDYGQIERYEVIDENLYTIFLLKWA
jgi:hypothetical protein